MATKQQVREMLNKIPDDEPLFLLRGQDILAPGIVKNWAQMFANASTPPGGKEKYEEAMECAEKMRKHHRRKMPD